MAQRIAVIGSGGIGGVIAEAAHAAGHEVTMCVRTPFERLVLDAPEGTSEIPVEVATDPGAVGECDWIVLTTKVHDVPGTAPWLNKLDDGSTPLVVVQNGVAHRESVAELGVRAPVLPALIYVGAERTGPGRVVRRSPTTMQVEGGELGSRFVALLEGSAVKLRATDDFHTAAWRKMLTNVAPNPITALTLRRLDVLADDDVRELCAGILAEAIAVARAESASLTQQDADKVLADYTARMPPTNGTSMLYDRIAGLPLEHEHITGALVSAADRHGIPVPLNRTLLTLLRAIKPAPIPGV
ncbi:2-dehydropantoate 2-reductase [Saccharopolyspora sp. TS4A08]|uniref:2-dehydropantoate 2-reductase n=1 Tax=Saccharopolyspora ipomoeae TaxID=3042027 RepID=A0ABT6PU31_9PSEU|nr:2-dehydropantoate 2-reductase [Saccharopolyspora sp. TS4A08]MDI2031509.1 2-dehydropantoate 2-reductase [Saccharopolyspora sp. TS4A08]